MIEITNLTKRYGDKLAVNNISFTIREGEILGFLGPNGAGKTTTLSILTGYLSSTEGSVIIDGIDILSNPTEAKKRLGYLPEQPPLYLDMTVKEYLNFVYDLKRCTLPRLAHLAEVCAVVKIADVYNRKIVNLSKGYRQRVGIAQAIIGNPEVLIFDEPTVGLDPKQIIEIRNLIKSLGKNHTIVLSSHILPEIQAVCDRVVVINQGVIVADDTPENLSHNVSGSRRLLIRLACSESEGLKLLRNLDGIISADTLGEKEHFTCDFMIESAPQVDIRKPLFFALAAKSLPLLGLKSLELSLEDVFIELVDGNQSKGGN